MTSIPADAVARKDWLEFVRDRRLLVAALMVGLLALAAVVTAAVRVGAHEADRRATETRDRSTWESQGALNPHGVAHFSKWALRPLTPLALLDPGVTPYAGSAVWMEAHSQNPARNRPIEDAAGGFDLGSFSVAWLLQTILPLLIFVVGAGALARERERGTLRMMLASGMTAERLLPRKLAAVARLAAVLTVPLLGMALVTALLSGAQDVARLLLWGGVYLVYFALVTAITVAVSAMSRTTSQAMLLLIGLWLFAAVLAPRGGVGLAEAASPTPEADTFWAGVAADMEKGPDVFGADADAFGASMARRYGVSRVEDLPVSIGGLQLDAAERNDAVVFDRRYGALARTYEAQRNALRWVGLVSPVPALQNMSMALAGTDGAHQQAFQQQAETHRRALVGQLNADMIANGAGKEFDYLADPALWKTTAEFAYKPPALGTVLRSVWPDALVLAGWSLFAVGLLSVAGRRLAREAL